MAAFIRNRLRMGLLLKMWLLGLVMAVSITLVFCYYVLPGYQARVFNERRAEVQSSVVTALGVLDSIHSLEEQGMLSTAEAQSWALAELNGLRHGQDGEGTFWVSDYQPVLLVDPTAPELVGTDVGNVTGADGEPVFVEMGAICQNAWGRGLRLPVEVRPGRFPGEALAMWRPSSPGAGW